MTNHRRRWLILAAHPDDETVGATWLLSKVPGAMVVHVTDGAPRDSRLWSSRAPSTRAAYARLRQQEAHRALALAGLGSDQIRCLGLVDQEAVHELVPLCRALQALLAEVSPAAVVAQPYEGGHPDHDACAFAARVAVSLHQASAGTRPLFLEMTSYHGRDGTPRAGSFLNTGPAEVELRLTPAELLLKRRMLECFESQSQVLRPLGVKDERLRPAPRYDFTQPPHPGQLYYESLGWPLRGHVWCYLAQKALDVLGLSNAAAADSAAEWSSGWG